MSSTSRRIWVIRCRWPAADRRAGHRDVDALLGQPPVELGARELGLARVDRRLEPLAERVQRHPGLAVAHLAERQLELALPPEVLDAHAARSRRVDVAACDRCERVVLECLGVHGSARGYQRPLSPRLQVAWHERPRTASPHECDARRVASSVTRVDGALRRIASIYDPWSRSVTEDVGFYVERGARVRRPRRRARGRDGSDRRARSRRPGSP